jgi:RND family efflux transporter MFP subunit
VASSVQRGERAEVELPALPGRRFSGTVSHVSASIDAATRAVSVRVELDNPDRALKPEMAAKITLYVDPRPVVVVPTSALVTRVDGGYAVFVRRDEHHFERRSVTVGAEFEDRAQVLEGLRPDEPIVVQGALLIDPSSQQSL